MKRNLDKSSSVIVLQARELQRAMTDAEKIMWQYFRNRLFCGLKFRRQFPIGSYITDFYCAEKNLIIEIDGSIHDEESQKERDLVRENNLRMLDFNIIRFDNKEVTGNIQKVLEKLYQFVRKK